MVRVSDCVCVSKYSGRMLIEGVKETVMGVAVVIWPVISNYIVSSLVVASKVIFLTSVLFIAAENSALFWVWVDNLNTYSGGKTDTFTISLFYNRTLLKEVTCMTSVPLKEHKVPSALVSTVQLKSVITWQLSSQPSYGIPTALSHSLAIVSESPHIKSGHLVGTMAGINETPPMHAVH